MRILERKGKDSHLLEVDDVVVSSTLRAGTELDLLSPLQGVKHHVACHGIYIKLHNPSNPTTTPSKSTRPRPQISLYTQRNG